MIHFKYSICDAVIFLDKYASDESISSYPSSIWSKRSKYSRRQVFKSEFSLQETSNILYITQNRNLVLMRGGDLKTLKLIWNELIIGRQFIWPLCSLPPSFKFFYSDLSFLRNQQPLEVVQWHNMILPYEIISTHCLRFILRFT